MYFSQHSYIVGDYSVCVNAATMALIDAGIPMKDFVCACSASYIEDTPILGEFADAMYRTQLILFDIMC